MTESTAQDQRPQSHQSQPADVWERWAWVWSAVFFVSLFVPFAMVMVGQPGPDGVERVQMVVLTGLLALWQIGCMLYARRVPDWRSHSLASTVIILVGIALWYPLVRINPAFYFTLAGLYSQIFFMLPPLWAIPVSVGLGMLVVVQGGTGSLDLRDPGLWAALAGIGFSVIFYIWISAIIDQSAKRKALIDELQRTQAELASAEREAGSLAERQRLAREIHDTLAQGFVSIVLHLEAAEQALPAGLPVVQQHLGQAKTTARQSLAQAREVVQDLRAQPVEGSPLPEAIRQVVQNWAEATGMATTVAITGDVRPMHPDVEVTLLRAVQEALANVRKHASASRLAVTLSYMGDEVVLDVQDDGIGIGAAATDPLLSSGYGLTAMRERVEQLHGSLLIESSPGEGTTLVVEIPLTGNV
jgi:signal transduction histidine kinase